MKHRCACRPLRPGRRALQALNFSMADMQAGVGPFLGVWLLAHGWQSGWIGSVMTVGGVAGVLMTTPAGAWVDRTPHKRGLVVVTGLSTVLASGVVLISQSFWPVVSSQIATAVAGAAIGPAVAGITLGMFRQEGFGRQLGINQAYNHAGNAVGAGLSGLLGWMFGLAAVFWLALVFAVASIVSVLCIPRGAIDDRAARGQRAGGASDAVSALSVLLRCRPLLVLAAALALFHLGNAAMLPLYGLAVVAARQGDPATLVAATIVVAQTTMIATALIAMRMAGTRGYWLVLLISFAALPVTCAACRGADQELGRVPGTDTRWRRRRTAERRGARPCGAHPERHRTRQCRPGCGDGRTRSRRFPQSGARGLDRAVEWLPGSISQPRCLGGRFGAHLGVLLRARAASLRGGTARGSRTQRLRRARRRL